MCNLPRIDDTTNEISRICEDRAQVVVLFQVYSSVFVLGTLRFGICGDYSACAGSVDNCPSTQITVLLEPSSYSHPSLCQQSVFIHFYLNCSLVYNDETKKNASAVLTMGTVESTRKGYISLFRSIVVLYTFLYCNSSTPGSSLFSLWIFRCSLASTQRHIFMASPSYSTWLPAT